MKILFDHQTFQEQKLGGISRYFTELIKHLPKERWDLPIHYSENIYLKQFNIQTFDKEEHRRAFNQKNLYLPFRSFLYRKKYKNILKLPGDSNKQLSIQKLRSGEFDVFHPTFFDPYFLDFLGKKPFVLTIHDMTYEIYPEMVPFEDGTIQNKKLLAMEATRIIAVSQNTKKDIIEHYKVPEEKIEVVYHGANIPHFSDADDALDEVLPENYILYIGGRDGYKNFLFMAYAIADIIKKSSFHLVCAGSILKPEEHSFLKGIGVDQRVKVVQASEALLLKLYRNAKAFIYPSIYEGFGLPILEAFANDCPVILSNTSCFPEIAGDAGVYFDPKEINSIQKSVEKVLFDNDLRSNLIYKGRNRVKEFSWKKTAEQTFEVYRSVIV